jgi:hypothetical protein
MGRVRQLSEWCAGNLSQAQSQDEKGEDDDEKREEELLFETGPEGPELEG